MFKTLCKRAALATLTGVLALTAFTACGSSEGAGGGTVRIATLKGQPHLYHPYFYEQFAPEGVDFEIVLLDSSPDIKNAVVSGAVDFGITGVPAAIAGISQGEKVKVIASAADGGSGFVGAPSIASVADLPGKKVGYPQGASQEILLRLTLANEGVNVDDLELVNLPFSDMAKALESGQIDAFLSAELGPSVAQQTGAKVLASPYDTPVGKVNIGLITTDELIADDPALVQKVVDTHKSATEYMDANHEEWAAGLVKTFGLEQPVVETAIGNIWPRWDLSEEYQAQVGELVGQMADLTTITSEPPTDQIIDTTFVGSDE